MATTLVYLQTKYKRIYDRANSNYNQGLVTLANDIARFDSSTISLDFTNENHTGMVFPQGLDITNEAFTISAWLKNPTDAIGQFCFIGARDNKTEDLDSWMDSNSETIYSDEVTPTTLTNFYQAKEMDETDPENPVETGTSNLITGAVVADDNWHHFAIVRAKNTSTDTDTIISFVDGIKVSSIDFPSSKKFYTDDLLLGASGVENIFSGEIDDFVFVKDVSLWTDNFTAPTDYLKNEYASTLTDIQPRQWSGSTDVIDVNANTNIKTWELLELEKPFQLKFS